MFEEECRRASEFLNEDDKNDAPAFQALISTMEKKMRDSDPRAFERADNWWPTVVSEMRDEINL
jgi:hypothetical protein